MEDAGAHKQSEQRGGEIKISSKELPPVAEEGGGVSGVCEHVEESQDEEGEDVLDVVLVSSPHPLDVLVGPALKIQCLVRYS